MSMLNESDFQSPFGPSDAEQWAYEAEQLELERERTLMELEVQIGPRPRVATVLRMMRVRR